MSNRDSTGCLFCESEDIRARYVFTTAFCAAFPTNIPIVPGHMLLVPLRHLSRWEEMTREEREDFEQARVRVCAALRSAFGAQGFNFAWNEGELAGQSIPHLHLHILPRKEGDSGIWQYEPRKFLYRPGSREPSPEAELRAVARLVRKHLPKNE